MEDYISRNALLKAIEDNFYSDILYSPVAFKELAVELPPDPRINRIMIRQEAVQKMIELMLSRPPIVRCCDCKYYNYVACSHPDHEYESHYSNYFCADAEEGKFDDGE